MEISSSFHVDNVECKISTKNGETKVNWCKATATMDKDELSDLVNGGFQVLFENYSDLFAAIESSPTNLDQILVEFELALLTNEIQNYLDNLDPAINLPDDYQNKSVAMERSTQNNDGVETSQTRILMEIEY